MLRLQSNGRRCFCTDRIEESGRVPYDTCADRGLRQSMDCALEEETDGAGIGGAVGK